MFEALLLRLQLPAEGETRFSSDNEVAWSAVGDIELTRAIRLQEDLVLSGRYRLRKHGIQPYEALAVFCDRAFTDVAEHGRWYLITVEKPI